MYAAIKAADIIDADGDGVAASVGLSLIVAWFEAAQANAPSTDPVDIAARDRIEYVYHHLVPDSIVERHLRQRPRRQRRRAAPDVDRQARLARRAVLLAHRRHRHARLLPGRQRHALLQAARLRRLPAAEAIRPSACRRWATSSGRRASTTSCATSASASTTLPLVVTEAGIATNVGARRTENIVRVLEQIERARADGVDVRGYYHWSLMDNFEWAEGLRPEVRALQRRPRQRLRAHRHRRRRHLRRHRRLAQAPGFHAKAERRRRAR